MAAVQIDTAPAVAVGTYGRPAAAAPAAPRAQPPAEAAPPPAAIVDPAPPDPALEQALREALEAAASRIREYLKLSTASLEFDLDDTSGRVVLRIVDGATGVLIRQIPSEEALAIAQALDRAIGVLLREQA